MENRQDAYWDRQEEACRQLLRSREKEAIRNQLNGRALFGPKEEERRQRAKETLAAWEEALSKLPRKKKEPKSELQKKMESAWKPEKKKKPKSSNCTTFSMETQVCFDKNTVYRFVCLVECSSFPGGRLRSKA